MQKELKGQKEVDTLRVTLLGFSLISFIILVLCVGYISFYFATNYEEFSPDDSKESQDLLSISKILLVVVLVLPQVFAFMLWLVMPSFVKHWYNLQPLPPEYTYIHDLVQEIASKIGVSPPKILYTHKEVPNCFNMGRTERESTIIISKWLADHSTLDELKAVLLHEMAHTKNRDVTLMAYLSAAKRIILLVPLFFLFGVVTLPSFFDYSPLLYLEAPEISAFLLVFFGFITFLSILLVLGIQWFSRLREIAADARVSLFIDKNILKRTLYKLACARSMRMLFISSSLMISGGKKGGGIFSGHPLLHERYLNLDRKRFIVDTRKSPPLTFCFTTALSIFVFTTFINIVVAVPSLFIEGGTWLAWLFFIFSAITAGLLFFYYPYLSIKYSIVIIMLITVIGSVFFLGLMVFAYWSSFSFSSPPPYIPPQINFPPQSIVPKNVDWIGTLVFFVLHRIVFATLTFLFTVFLRLAKTVLMARH
jgi:Zn-dependent protease with chaperone function